MLRYQLFQATLATPVQSAVPSNIGNINSISCSKLVLGNHIIVNNLKTVYINLRYNSYFRTQNGWR